MGDEVSSLKYLSSIKSEIIEMVAAPDSPVTKKPIRELKIKDGLIGGIVRGKKAFIAMGDFQIEAGDKVVVFALKGATPKVEKMFCKSGFSF